MLSRYFLISLSLQIDELILTMYDTRLGFRIPCTYISSFFFIAVSE